MSVCASGSRAIATVPSLVALASAPPSTRRTDTGWASPLGVQRHPISPDRRRSCAPLRPASPARRRAAARRRPVLAGQNPKLDDVGVDADQLHRLAPRRPPHRHLLAQQPRRRLHPRQPADRGRQPLVEAVAGARHQLQARRADQPVQQIARGAHQTAVGHQHPEHQRHPHGDPAAGQQLLHGVAAQAPTVEAKQHAGAHAEDRRIERGPAHRQLIRRGSSPAPRRGPRGGARRAACAPDPRTHAPAGRG